MMHIIESTLEDFQNIDGNIWDYLVAYFQIPDEKPEQFVLVNRGVDNGIAKSN